MNGKRIAALAFAAALTASAAPAFAANTGTVTIKWNTQTVSNIALVTQYDGAPVGTHNLGAETILANLNGGGGACQASDTEPAPGNVVNFGAVTPDAVQYTDCLEKNAINAVVTTNDTNGYNVKEAATSAYPAAGFLVCLLPNGTWANNLVPTASVRAAAPSIVSTTACGAGNFNMDTTGATLLATAAQTAGTNIGGDVELVTGPSAPSGAQAPIITYTLTTL